MDLSSYQHLNKRMCTEIINAVYKFTLDGCVNGNMNYVQLYLSNFGIDINKAKEIKNELYNKKLSTCEKLYALNKYGITELVDLYLSFFDKLMGNRYLTYINNKENGIYIEKRLCYREIFKKDKKVFYYIINNESEGTLKGFRSTIDYDKNDVEKIIKKSSVSGLSVVLEDNILSSKKASKSYWITDLFGVYKKRKLFLSKKEGYGYFLESLLNSILENVLRSRFFRKTKFYNFFMENKKEKGYSKINRNVYDYLSEDKRQIVKYWRSIGCEYDKDSFDYFIRLLYFLTKEESIALYSLMKTYPFIMKVVIDDLKNKNNNSLLYSYKPLLIKNIVSGNYPFYYFMEKEFNLKKNEVKKLKGLTNQTAGSLLEGYAGGVLKSKNKNFLKYISTLDAEFINKKSNIYKFYSRVLFFISSQLYNLGYFSILGDFDFFKYINNQLLFNQKNKYSLNYRKYTYYSDRGKTKSDLSERVIVDSRKRQEFLEFSDFYKNLIVDGAYRVIKKDYKHLNYNKEKLSLLVLNYFFKSLSPYCLFNLAEIFHERYLTTSEMVNKYCAEKNVNYEGLKLFTGSIDIGAYKFTDISTANELYNEGNFMNHCVASYADTVNKNISSIIKVEPLFESCVIRERTTLNIKFVKKSNKFGVCLLQNSSFDNIPPTESNNKAVSDFIEYLKKNIGDLNYKKVQGQALSSSIIRGSDNINIIRNNFPWEYRYYLSLIPKYKMGLSLDENINIAINKIINNKDIIKLSI